MQEMQEIKENLTEMMFWHKSLTQDLASMKRKIKEIITQVDRLEAKLGSFYKDGEVQNDM